MLDEQVKRKRGRPRKNPVVEENQASSSTLEISDQTSNQSVNNSYEFNSYYSPSGNLIFDTTVTSALN